MVRIALPTGTCRSKQVTVSMLVHVHEMRLQRLQSQAESSRNMFLQIRDLVGWELTFSLGRVPQLLRRF